MNIDLMRKKLNTSGNNIPIFSALQLLSEAEALGSIVTVGLEVFVLFVLFPTWGKLL